MNPSGPVDEDVPRSYFFLSYAHSAPATDQAATDTDHWVRVFFHHLLAEVQLLAHPDPGTQLGFFDDLLPPGSDWKTVLSGALSGAEVFIPLYSPGYLSKSWPLQERDMFRQRLIQAGAVSGDSTRPGEATVGARPGEATVSARRRVERHIVPVLWIPLPSWERDPELDRALDLGSGVPGYAENGLRALCMLAGYRRQYRQIVHRLARRIVDIAENHPVGPSPLPAFGGPPPSSRSLDTDLPAGETPLIVAVAAPTTSALPPGRTTRPYGPDSAGWRPFKEGQALPAGEYVANVAERLGLSPRVGGLREARALFDRCPAVLLLDPWSCATAQGRRELRATIATAPKWVVPLLIVDRSDPQYDPAGADLVAEITDMLNESSLPQLRQAGQLEEFAQIMPVLVTEARRRYLNNAAVSRPTGPGPEPVKPDLGGRHDEPPRRAER